MTFTAISDIHIKSSSDQRYKLLINFINHQLVCHSDQIFLLGDIFDLAIGGHAEYYDLYSEFFDRLINLSKQGKTIRFFEGNHDFHLEGLFEYLQSEKGLENFYYYKKDFQTIINKKIFIFDHGDNIEQDETIYILWKSFINNPFMKLIMNDFFRFKFIQKIGFILSKKSRKRNASKYENTESQEMIRVKYRKNAKIFYQKRKFDFLIMGHSHVHEELITERYGYFNCGYLPITKCFLYFNGELVKSVEINEQLPSSQ